MDYQASDKGSAIADAGAAERRQSPRFTSLIRSAKLVCPQGEFVCVIRDVSETGIGLRTFHQLPEAERMELVLQNGLRYELDKVRATGPDASFTFAESVDVQALIVETGKFPKRQLRVSVNLPAKVNTLTQSFSGEIQNLSQQGALLYCDAMFAIEQPIRIDARYLPEVRAKVRWRQENAYGLAFDNHFGLSEFARLCAKLQCPELIQQ